MARNKSEVKVNDGLVTDAEEKELAEKYASAVAKIGDQDELKANAQAVAIRINYDGPMSTESLMDGIRFYQVRTVESCLELGKRLTVLKELTPHGQFEQAIEQLGMEKRVARRFMQTAFKMAKASTSALLQKIDSQSKLFELLVLDDDEIEALDSGDSINGLTLDKIETMSVSELRKALRESKNTIANKDKVIQQKNLVLDRKTEELAAIENKVLLQKPEEQILRQRDRFQRHATTIKNHVMVDLRRELKELYEQDGDHRDFAAACFIEIFKELTILRDEYGLERVIREDGMPEWLTPEALAEIESMGGEA